MDGSVKMTAADPAQEEVSGADGRSSRNPEPAQRSSVVEVFWRFLVLGCGSFGGPTAHLGYFREVFVRRLGWIDEASYGATIGLCQFLPGPGSSQVGFALGLRRAGLAGGVAAFLGFTLPSFALMLGLALLDRSVVELDWFRGGIAGLKLLAAAVVAHAVVGMASSFWRGFAAATIGAAVTVAMLLASGVALQIVVLALSAVLGALLLGGTEPAPEGTSTGRGPWWPLALFVLLLAGLPLLALPGPAWSLFEGMVRVGSLVFGGGHVVLPLLQASFPQVGDQEFLVGYAAAQGVPGPMFSLSTYLGAVILDGRPLLGALVATAGIFLPGFLLVLGLQGRWARLAGIPRLAGAFAGINAAVVGLLAAAFVRPVLTTAVIGWIDAVLVVVGFVILRHRVLGLAWLVLLAVAVGALRASL